MLLSKMNVILSKFKGCLVGAVVGDCVGAHFEMESPKSIQSLIGYIKQVVEQSKEGNLILSPG